MKTCHHNGAGKKGPMLSALNAAAFIPHGAMCDMIGKVHKPPLRIAAPISSAGREIKVFHHGIVFSAGRQPQFIR
jgi:hypothetical protein